MNVRLSAGEVRLRVNRDEAEALARGEPLAEELAFPGGARFGWRVEARGRGATAALERGGLLVTVGAEDVRDLLAGPPSKDAGVVAELPAGGGATLKVSLEIDLHGARKR